MKMGVFADEESEPLLPDLEVSLQSRLSGHESRLSRIYNTLVARPSVSIERVDGQLPEQPSSFFKEKVKEKKRCVYATSTGYHAAIAFCLRLLERWPGGLLVPLRPRMPDQSMST